MFKEFDSLVEQSIPKYAEMVSQIVFPVLIDRNEVINCLDIGCGAGRSSYEILTSFPNAQLTCFDVDKKQLEKAKTSLAEFSSRIEFAEGDFSSHDFDEQFDIIISTFTLSHLEKQEKLEWLRKIRQLLAENGYFICADKVSFRSIELNDAFDVVASGQSKPLPVTSELFLLKKANFSLRDIVWRYREYAVWYARK